MQYKHQYFSTFAFISERWINPDLKLMIAFKAETTSTIHMWVKDIDPDSIQTQLWHLEYVKPGTFQEEENEEMDV